jgi:hypothetical protein
VLTRDLSMDGCANRTISIGFDEIARTVSG